MDDKKNTYRSHLSKIILVLATVLITLGVIELAGRLAHDRDKFSVIENIEKLTPGGNPAGYELRKTAWEASFSERGLIVPPGGPREGLRGEGVTPLRCAVSDCGFKKLVPGYIEVNDGGIQTVGVTANPYPHILIVGGSVAWGAGASDIANTYFSRLYGMLKNEYPDMRISVLAYYGSTSNTDLSSFVQNGLDMNPDVVLFLNGLNDLTVKGQIRHTDASDYILNMKTAARIAERNGIPVVIVRQPFPGEKNHKTDLEERIMELSNKDYDKVVTPLYNHIGKALEEMAKRDGIYYIDAADCFAGEMATTFNDQWHFSDPVHELLAERIYTGLAPVLNKITAKGEIPPN
ncbi:MAG: SGNH/GDSL hydrolase family protein [Thermodesulfobacteriota bacterium]